jgi:hypothetical protein
VYLCTPELAFTLSSGAEHTLVGRERDHISLKPIALFL